MAVIFVLSRKQASGSRAGPSALGAPAVILTGPAQAGRHIRGGRFRAWMLAACEGAVKDVCVWGAEVCQTKLFQYFCDFTTNITDIPFRQRAKGHMTHVSLHNCFKILKEGQLNDAQHYTREWPLYRPLLRCCGKPLSCLVITRWLHKFYFFYCFAAHIFI